MTEGEQNFEAFLRQLGWTWDRELPFGIKVPDYLVHAPGQDILTEIKDFGEGDLDKAILKGSLETLRPFLKEGDAYTKKVDQELKRLVDIEGSQGGAFNPFDRVQRMVRTAATQLRPAKGKLPCLPVLYNPGYMVYERDLLIRQGVAQNRYFSPDRNTTVSGLAILDETQPNKRLLRHALDQKSSELTAARGEPRTKQELYERALAVQEAENALRAAHADGFFEQTVFRLRIYPNPFAAFALPASSLQSREIVIVHDNTPSLDDFMNIS